MNDEIKVIFTFIGAVIALITAIFGLKKAHIDLKNVLTKKEKYSTREENYSNSNESVYNDSIVISNPKKELSESVDSRIATLPNTSRQSQEVIMNQHGEKNQQIGQATNFTINNE